MMTYSQGMDAMALVDSYQLQLHNPLSQPSWRSNWSQRLVEQGHSAPKHVDSAGLAALRLARHLHVHKANGTRDEIDGQLADELGALAIHRDDPVLRNLLQAWLLSGATDVQIGMQLGVAPAVVHAYEQVFYAVRDRLRAADWIVVGVICWSINPDGPRDLAAIVKLLGYFGGPMVLRVVIAALDLTGAHSTARPTISVAEPLAARIRLLVDLLANPPEGVLALRLLNQLQEINARRLQPAGSCLHQSQLDLSVASALDGVDWPTFGVPDDKTLYDPAIATVA